MTKFLLTNIIFIVLIGAQVFFLNVQAYQLTIPITVGIYIGIISVAVTSMRMQFFCKALCHGPRDLRRIALTFDDGPEPQTTPVLLELLRKHNIKATFFVIGTKAERYPAIIKQLTNAGHLVANHSYSHPWYFNFLFGKALEKQILRTKDILKEIMGSDSLFFRPPMGFTNPHYRKILEKHNMRIVGWDIRTFDKNRKKHQIVEKIFKKKCNGSIILMHDSGVSIEKLQYIISTVAEKLQAQGYSFVRIDEMAVD